MTDAGEQIRGVVLLQGDVDAGVHGVETGEELRQVEGGRADGADGSDLQPTLDQPGEGSDVRGSIRCCVESRPRVRQEGLTRGGQTNTLFCAVQQWLPEFALKLPDLRADARLSDVEPFARPG